MNDLSVAGIRFQSRSMGIKLLILGLLALLMTIPALFVYGIISDRMDRAKTAAKEVGGLLGGQQTVLGPLLLVPSINPVGNALVVYPVTGQAVVRTKTQERHRSLFRVPVYQSQIEFHAKFDFADISTASEASNFDWKRALFVIGVTDVRGAADEPTLTVSGKKFAFIPLQDPVDPGGLTLLSVAAAQSVTSDSHVDVAVNLQLNGAERLAIPAFAKSTAIEVNGDWRNPGFDGGFLPTKHTIGNDGFQALWTVPFIARGVPAFGNIGSLSTLEKSAVGVSFVDLASPYQSVTRSVKYVLLFLVLIFLAYFSFEVSTGKRVHPAQYTLVGTAQIIFYLLLLSFSERVGFNVGFTIASLATIALLSGYAGGVFGAHKYALQAAGMFSVVYLIVYLLLTLEDESLLLGSIVAFAALSVVMYRTRNLDWYSALPANSSGPSPGKQVAVPSRLE